MIRMQKPAPADLFLRDVVSMPQKETGMLLKLVALGAAGYAGYKYMMQGRRETYPPSPSSPSSGNQPQAAAEDTDPEPEVALAGGPLSSGATLVHKDEEFPAT
jgi:hypothetical protein